MPTCAPPPHAKILETLVPHISGFLTGLPASQGLRVYPNDKASLGQGDQGPGIPICHLILEGFLSPSRDHISLLSSGQNERVSKRLGAIAHVLSVDQSLLLVTAT